MSFCHHACCAIPDNGYHRHAEPPVTCPRCARARPDAETPLLGAVMASVMSRVVPHIPGLPGGAALANLVTRQSLATYTQARDDPEVQALGDRERRTVLAGRVGLALAFPCGDAAAVPAAPVVGRPRRLRR